MRFTLAIACSGLILTSGCHEGSSTAANPKQPPAVDRDTSSSSVQVYVSREIRNGLVRYRYRIVNGSPYLIKGFTVGYDHETGQAYLNLLPAGWSEESGTPPSSVVAPPGWSVQLTPSEEDSVGILEWTTMDDAKAILGGHACSEFEVVVPRVDSGYEASHWTVYIMSPDTPAYTGVLKPETWRRR